MSAKFVLALCCCCLLIAGCSPAINKDTFLSTFAGEYKFDGYGSSAMFTINSDGTYTDVSYPSSGYVFTDTGKIYLKNGNTTFYHMIEGKGGPEKLRYVPVIWGDRKYLFLYFSGFKDIRIIEFCNGVADGSTIQKEDEEELYEIFIHTDNVGVAVYGEPELIDGKKFCQQFNPEGMP